MSYSLAAIIANKLAAISNCIVSGNAEWKDRHESDLESIMSDEMPSGSGFDCGTKLDSSSTPSYLVFNVAFHHMDEHGGYDGWTEHQVIVTPTFDGVNVRVSGRNRNGIKEYIAETFHETLTQRREMYAKDKSAA